MPTNRSINCPACDSQMVPGVIVGRSPGVKFKPKKGIMGDLTGIPLTTGFFNHTADALRCQDCGIVVIMPSK